MLRIAGRYQRVAAASAWRPGARLLSSTPAPTVAERPSKLRRFGRFLGYTSLTCSALALSGACLVSINITDERRLPLSLRRFAVSLEGFWRFLVTARHVLPMVAEWLMIEKIGPHVVESSDELNEWRDKAHKHTAKRLLRLVRAQGGIYVKSGQHLCASPVMPPVYVDTLKVLMDNAVEQPMAETERTFMEDFGVDIHKDFARIDPTPIATASLAQVYRGRMRNDDGTDGPEVAIKVQHRSVNRLFDVDLSTMQFIYAAAAYVLPNFDMRIVAEEMSRAFREELDFMTELQNCIEVHANFLDRKDLCVPVVFPERCSDRVLTMEFEEGVRIDDLEGIKYEIIIFGCFLCCFTYEMNRKMELDPAKIMTTLMEVFSEMMFQYGFVHCDPHPGYEKAIFMHVL